MRSFMQTVLLVGGSAELKSLVAERVHSVAACELRHLSELADAIDVLLTQVNVGLVLVHVNVNDAPQEGHVCRLLEIAQGMTPAVPVVILAEEELAARHNAFLRAGAADCLLRPLNLSRLGFLIDFLTLRARSLGPCASNSASAPVHESGLIFESERSRTLLQAATRLARVDTTVLLCGATGTGKTNVARLIHDRSPRRAKPFVVVNCGAIPESLVESELFGHRQGAFTGADREHRGKFTQAEDGTLFLDEIDSLSLAAQSKLLRVVDDRAFEPIGSAKTEQVRARLLFATNRDLGEEVQAGRFRQDLFFRLNVVALSLPPLCQRFEEIPLLVNLFLQGLRAKGVTIVERFSDEALAAMAAHSWPGNMRELRNVVERLAVMLDRPVVTRADLPEEFRQTQPAQWDMEKPLSNLASARNYGSLTEARRGAERGKILHTLALCSQNRSRTAEALGISRTALYKKIQLLGIT